MKVECVMLQSAAVEGLWRQRGELVRIEQPLAHMLVERGTVIVTIPAQGGRSAPPERPGIQQITITK